MPVEVTSPFETSPGDVHSVQAAADEIRRLVLLSVHHAKAGHVGGPFSVAEILATLYFCVMQVDPQRPRDPLRDRLVLSKGHSAIGLYAALALRGYFHPSELDTFDSIDSRLQGHPDMSMTPGVDMSTGSLGMGLSAGAGIALGARLLGHGYRTYVVLGDAECQEGQVWEAAMFAAAQGLCTLTAIVDCNGLGQWGEGRERYEPVPAMAEKWQAFGWDVHTVDGHDVGQISSVLGRLRSAQRRPAVMLAETVKGKGVSFMEGKFDWHSRVPSDKELEQALSELRLRTTPQEIGDA